MAKTNNLSSSSSADSASVWYNEPSVVDLLKPANMVIIDHTPAVGPKGWQLLVMTGMGHLQSVLASHITKRSQTTLADNPTAWLKIYNKVASVQDALVRRFGNPNVWFYEGLNLDLANRLFQDTPNKLLEDTLAWGEPSSNVHGFMFRNGHLDITFHSGKTYRYFEVPEAVVERFRSDPSKGSFVAESIVNKYDFELMPFDKPDERTALINAGKKAAKAFQDADMVFSASLTLHFVNALENGAPVSLYKRYINEQYERAKRCAGTMNL